MKKIALLALTLILLLTTALPMTVAADESSAVEDASNVTEAIPTSTRVLDPNKLNVCLGSGAAKQGDLVEIPVTVETNPGVWGLTLEVHYDMNIMVLQNVKFSDAFKKDMACLDIDNVTVSSNQKNYDSPFTLYAEGNSLTSNVKTTGLFATLTFLVIPDCELGETEISMSYKPDNVIDEDNNNVPAAMYSGLVCVSKSMDAEPIETFTSVASTISTTDTTTDTTTPSKNKTTTVVNKPDNTEPFTAEDHERDSDVQTAEMGWLTFVLIAFVIIAVVGGGVAVAIVVIVKSKK